MREFPSARLKWERAQTHIAEFERERSLFLKTEPCRVRPHYNSETAHTDYIVEHVTEVPPVIALIVGDVIHNLRCALDHLAAALVRANNKSPGLCTAFPVCTTEEAFRDRKARKKIERMSPVDQERLRLIQPYFRKSDALLGLHRLDITDKHDLLIAHTQCAGAVEHRFDESDVITTSGVPTAFPRKIVVPLLGKLPKPECGKVLISYPGKPEENQNIKPLFDIAFGDVPVFKEWLVRESLTQMAKEVEGIYRAFERTTTF